MKTTIISILIVLFVSDIFAQTSNSDSLFFANKISQLEQKIQTLNEKLNQLEKGLSEKITTEEFNLLKVDFHELKESQNKLKQKIDEELLNSKETKKKIAELKREQKKLFASHKKSKKEIRAKLDSLNKNIALNSKLIKETETILKNRISETFEKADNKISHLNNALDKNTLYWIIAILFVFVITLALYVITKKQLFKQKDDLADNIEKTRKTLEEESIKLDGKLIELLEKQLNLLNEQTKKESVKLEEQDHSLALKVADEIVRIRKNLSRMDPKTKGLKQLNAAVKRIEDNFVANGYEIVDMLGKPYNEGLRVDVDFIPDENLKKGEKIITRIIKPQVNYKGVMVQAAQVEVSVGNQ